MDDLPVASAAAAAAAASVAAGSDDCRIEFGYDPVRPNDLASLLTDPNFRIVLIDVRPMASFRRAHIRGATNVPCVPLQLEQLASGAISPFELAESSARSALAEQCRESSYILLCDETSAELAPRSPLAVVLAAFRRMGFTNITYVAGGVTAFTHVSPSMIKRAPAANRPAPLKLVPAAPRRVAAAAAAGGDCGHQAKRARPLGSSDVDEGCSTTSPATQASPQAPSQIEAGLFLGNSRDAADRNLLLSLNIHYILNVTDDLPNVLGEDPAFKCHRIPLRDAWHQNLLGRLEEAFAFIEEARANNVGILIHCLAGISRSSTIVIAYLMQSQRKSLFEALTTVRAARPNISPNLDFMGQLLQFEASLGMESSSLALLLGDQ